ncbi:thiamine diphosphokinase [Parasedimentitalea marina]|uniref:thiamine diphosphokinase n=1 Tax=Parasedimentitalea marina TaxID=2483033 RepID=UPI001EE97C04|nr:thiamine diphosphokinase [Parasedimentitalea marina]
MIVDQIEPVTLVGGGAVAPGDLELALSLAPFLVAADSGADRAIAAGFEPRAVIGDLDSLSNVVRNQLAPNRIFEVAEQDSTDFHKALRHIKAPVVLAVGFLGERVDHQLAGFNTLVQPLGSPCILLGEHELIFHIPRQINLPTRAGDIVSLFPMGAVTGCSTGLKWPLDGVQMSPMGLIGTSNEATGPVSLTPNGPGLLGIIPRHHLPQLMPLISRSLSW